MRLVCVSCCACTSSWSPYVLSLYLRLMYLCLMCLMCFPCTSPWSPYVRFLLHASAPAPSPLHHAPLRPPSLLQRIVYSRTTSGGSYLIKSRNLCSRAPLLWEGRANLLVPRFCNPFLDSPPLRHFAPFRRQWASFTLMHVSSY